MLKIGIIGAGIIGDAHAGAISRLDCQRVEAIAEPVGELRDRFAATYSVPKAYDNWTQLVSDDSIDVVYIGTPNDLHMPIAIAAMESGKDVVCEKPLARNPVEGKIMIDAAQRTDRKLFIALNHRFVPSNQRVKQMLEAGEIGRPFLAMSTFIGNEFARMSDPTNWKGTKERSGGGALIDNGTHMIDLLRWWFGDAVAVTAGCSRQAICVANKEEDTATLDIEFASGTLAQLSVTFAARHSAWPPNYCGAAIRTEIFGLDGSIRVGNDGPALQFIKGDGTLTVLEQSRIQTGMPGSLQEHFAECIRDGAEPIVTARDGLAALEIVDAGYRSASTGNRIAIDPVCA